MRTVSDFPRPSREIDGIWVPLPDGTHLSARLWLPEDAEQKPVPAILEYLPYRHRDGTYERDARNHRYLAGHGYACLRVDLRGSGDSEGLPLDEYVEQEQDDALEVIAWLAAQPWCSGAVGMMGISWGGFNALQVAARRPPALRAIITVASTDDRYADDAHYMGGCLLGANMEWGCTFFANSARPPDPQVTGVRWRTVWLERLSALNHPVEMWMRHPLRDAYWRHGSVCEDYGAITCAVYAVGGWEDGYSNAVPRLLAGLTSPRKGLIGPWAHSYPHLSHLQPIGFLQECLRWWDYWLKGQDTGIMAEPVLRVWMQDSAPPMSRYTERPGRWIAEATWPSPRIVRRQFHLGPERLLDKPAPEMKLDLLSPETTGVAGGVWCPYGYDGDMPTDQRDDDERSLTFDSEKLVDRLELLGAPEVELDLASNRPAALIVVRLCDVAPDGASTRVSYGMLNLTHRDGHDHAMPLLPGERVRVRLRLNDLAHAFLPQHRLRLAVSTSYWPMVWPSPEPVRLTLFAGTLVMPERPPSPVDECLAPFDHPESSPGTVEIVEPAGRSMTVERNIAADKQVMRFHKRRGRLRFPAHGLETDMTGVETYTVRPDDPLSARCEIAWTSSHERELWRVRVQTRTLLTATRDTFRLRARLEAFENDEAVIVRNWDAEIPRERRRDQLGNRSSEITARAVCHDREGDAAFDCA